MIGELTDHHIKKRKQTLEYKILASLNTNKRSNYEVNWFRMIIDAVKMHRSRSFSLKFFADAESELTFSAVCGTFEWIPPKRVHKTFKHVLVHFKATLTDALKFNYRRRALSMSPGFKNTPFLMTDIWSFLTFSLNPFLWQLEILTKALFFLAKLFYLTQSGPNRS